MENYLKEMIKKGICFEVHNDKLFGLKWGESKAAQTLGFKRKDVIACLKWCDKNPEIALKLLGI